jgi:radical SAM superfamily enzyme YgiQ (UPF0313 family)
MSSVDRSALNATVSGSETFGPERRTDRPIVLVGFQRQANLGLGYLASYVRQHGYRVEVVDCELPHAEILEAVRRSNPILVGFSLIFQFYIDRFGQMMQVLRAGGVDCHFTMGGHFPSLSYEQCLALLPELDSVVRFEGEATLLDLIDRLSVGRVWQDVPGLAYRLEGRPMCAPLRPLIRDLDTLPYPERDFTRDNSILGRKAIPLLASRGCARTCSFCSIHMFYRAAPGKVVRTRKPAEVVLEMRYLHDVHGITIFLFQDDDFPLFGQVWQRWALELVGELHRAGLADKVIWKINCRADAVEPELLARMQGAGLYLVYMGLESGTDEGLKALHKQMTVEQNLRAVATLKRLGLLFEFGFMLLDPSSTFESVRANVQFLRDIVGDGSAGAVFCRMIPYDGTPIKEELAASGRLRGDVCNPDYDFLDPRLSEFYDELSDIVNVTGWVHGYSALSPQLNWAWNELAVMQHLFPTLDGLPEYQESLRSVTADSNELLFRVVEDLSFAHSRGDPHSWSAAVLARECELFQSRLLTARDEFVLAHQAVLLESLENELTAVT